MLRKIFTSSVVVLTIFWAVGLAAFVPTAQALSLTSGDLIKASLPAVYYYGADGNRYVFPNQPTYMSWYSDFSMVKTITDGELATIPIGGNVTYRPGVKMLKINTDPKVYAVAANGTLRWVQTESVAACLYGSNWGSMIHDVSDAFFVNYTVGSPIADCGAFDPASATASATSINVDKGLASAGEGVLNVGIASDTPAAQTVSTGASANMTKITLKTGDNPVTLKSMYITRYGLSNNANITNIKLVDSMGSTAGNVGSLNTNSKALITFVPELQLASNSNLSYWIRASIGAGATPGETVALGIATADDVVVGSAVTGAFPVIGNYHSIVNLVGTIGTATVGQDAPVVDSNPDAGDERVLATEFYIQAGANEDLTVESISLKEAGSANTSDSANIELYSLTEARSLCTVSAWNANSQATCGALGLVIPKGAKHIFQGYLDVIGGSGQTIDLDLIDGGDVLVDVKGNTYGFYLAPAVAGGWDGQGIPGAGGQTVNAGSLNVSASVDTPPAGNITQTTEQHITTWDYEVRGEPAKITSTMVTLTLGGVGPLALANLSNARLYDETDTLVAGPIAVTANPLNFTDTYIVETGTHQYKFVVDVLNSALAGGTIMAGIATPNTQIAATGMNTNDPMVISTAPANGKVQTIQGVALAVNNGLQPAARPVAVGTQDFVFETASLDASGSGEDVRVSSVTVRDIFVDGGVGKVANANDLVNMEVWADLTSDMSARGDVFETKVSNTVQPANNAVSPAATAIALSQTITVPKDSYVDVCIVADIETGADGGGTDTHQTEISAVTALGKNTGNVPVVGYSFPGTNVITLTGAGTLTVSIDASSPDETLLVSGDMGKTLLILKLAANKVENMDLDSVYITDNFALGVAQAWYLYASARADGGSVNDPIATASPDGTGSANFIIPDGRVTIPSDGNVKLTVKADASPVDGVIIANGMPLQPVTLVVPADIQATGKSSGLVINDVVTGLLTGQAHPIYASAPTVSLNASSPSGSLVPSANSLLAIFNVTADTADDITFDGATAPGPNAGNSLTVEVASSCAGAGVAGNFVLKDGSGNVLDTLAATNLCVSGPYTFGFATKDHVISAGLTDKWYVYGNTTGFSASGDSIQLWLDDSVPGNIDWSINYDGNNYWEEDIIFRGDIYANALVKG